MQKMCFLIFIKDQFKPALSTDTPSSLSPCFPQIYIPSLPGNSGAGADAGLHEEKKMNDIPEKLPGNAVSRTREQTGQRKKTREGDGICSLRIE